MKTIRQMLNITLFIAAAGFLSTSLQAENKKEETDNSQQAIMTKEAIMSSNKHDFTETLINGKMKAPTGFYITGRNTQSMTQMVKLRANFRKEMEASFHGAKIMSH